MTRLILRLRDKEKIVIGKVVVLQYLKEVRGKSITRKLMIEAPKEVLIERQGRQKEKQKDKPKGPRKVQEPIRICRKAPNNKIRAFK